ncbi:WG repeat-containing protein [uncultured Acetobacterium sp.]|uniref:WG repeat-containing protein n=1 Tax=uncultured Acetobacterium sp. TaxID=217139 RepID=UPI0025D5E3E1|nr:WG repeat-containing protein [uncultured Acetobacterium sp.]
MSNDRECIPIIYDEIEDVYDVYDGGVFDTRFFMVTKNNRKGVLNTKNEVEIPIIYENLINAGFDGDPYCDEDNLYYVIEENGKQGMINRKNNVLIPVIYDRIGENGGFEMIPIGNYLYIKVMKDEQFGLYNMHREMVLPAVYDHIEALKIKRHRNCEPALMVSKNHKTGVVDLNNQVILPIIYDKIGYLPIEIGNKTGHYFFVAKDQKKGFLDIHGEPIIPIIYDRLKVIGSEDRDLVKFLALKDGTKQEIIIKVTESDWPK